MKKTNKMIRYNLVMCGLLWICLLVGVTTQASTVDSVNLPGMTINLKDDATPKDVTGTLEMIFVITMIALAPSILIMMTSFLRILITLHFVRSAIGTMTVPPNQILIGISLFLTFFIMSPVISEIKTQAVEPYEKGIITQAQALDKGVIPLKKFMLEQAEDEDLSLFMSISDMEPVEDMKNLEEKVPLYVIVPAFIISELRAGFIIGFMIYIPFIVIDMVVAATLMSMGMMMLPPATISLPFKILLFILVDGWNLVITQLIQTF